MRRSHKTDLSPPIFARRRQKTAEETIKQGRTRLTGGAKTLGDFSNVKRAPLWIAEHGETQTP